VSTNNRHHAHVGDIIRLMENFAPPLLAEDWDNCGLQVGDAGWRVKKIWVALDPLLEVIEAANQQHVDLVVTHHPLLIQPVKRIDLKTTIGKIIAVSLQGKTAIYAAHTNLDSTWGGVNDILAHRIGLTDLKALAPATVDVAASGTIRHDGPIGLGRIGGVGSARTVSRLAMDIKKRLGLDVIRVAGDSNRMVRKAAVCSGSGGGLLSAFIDSGADVFISGDIKYHDARLIEDAGRGLIDVGHFASEHLIIDPLVDYLGRETGSAGWDVSVEACRLECDPFVTL
jgi:dinuclear metal center YbgI/SA1388 family protein